MGKMIRTLLLVSLGLSLMACQPDKKKQRLSRNGHVGARTAGTQFGQSIGFGGSAGAILSSLQGPYSEQSERDFQNRVDYFVSSGFDPFDPETGIGTVSGNPGANTGVRFWGEVHLDSGLFNPNSGQSGRINPQNSRLEMVIWDSHAPSKGELRLPFQVIDGYVNGGSVTLNLVAEYKQVTFQGTVDSNGFSGTVTFENERYWDDDGDYGASGGLGVFFVPTCGFFVCSN